MSRGFSPELILRTIPGWEYADWSPLRGGLTNQSFLIEQPGQRAVLKIDRAPRSAPLNCREAERAIQDSAAREQLANRVLFARKGIYLTEYVDGGIWSADNLQDPKNIEALARLLRRVHALPLTGRKFDAIEAARQYLTRLNHIDEWTAIRCEEIIWSMRLPENLHCCHNDLVVDNIIATPSLRLLDWEYACDNDPLFDLATVIAHYELGDEAADRLLDSYFDGDSPCERVRLEDYIQLYNALLWLWTASRPNHDKNSLAAIARRLRESH